MAGLRLLNGVDGKRANGVDRKLIDILFGSHRRRYQPLQTFDLLCAASLRRTSNDGSVPATMARTLRGVLGGNFKGGWRRLEEMVDAAIPHPHPAGDASLVGDDFHVGRQRWLEQPRISAANV